MHTCMRAYKLADKFFFHNEIKISSDIRRVQGGNTPWWPVHVAVHQGGNSLIVYPQEFMAYILYTSHTCKELEPGIRAGIIFQFDCGSNKTFNNCFADGFLVDKKK